MNYIINPYNALAFYEEPMDHHLDNPVNSPHEKLPPFQLKLSTSEISGGGTYSIVDKNLNSVKPLLGVIETAVSGGFTYVTYRAEFKMSTVLNEGYYRVKIQTNDRILYSHAICASQNFRQLDFQMVAFPSALSGGGCEIAFNTFTFDPDMEKSMEINSGLGYSYLGASSGTYDTNDLAVSGSYTLNVRQNVFYPDGSKFYRQYDYVGNTSGCVATSFGQVGVGGYNYNRWAYLEWENTNDIKNFNLYYSDNYQQRLYFNASLGFPTPVVDESFLTNGNGDSYLESASLAEQVSLDIWPVPDYLFFVLQSVRYHDSVKLIVCADEQETEIKNFSVSRREAPNETSPVLEITGEINRAFINACQENETTA